jgi:hypothetical protein
MNKLIYPFEQDLFDLLGLDEDFIRGYDRGTNEFADVITQSVDGADLNSMWREFQASVALLNRQKTPLINMLTFDVGQPTERVLLPVSDDFEEATEYGEPKGIRLGVPFISGYDFKWYDIALRYTWLFLAESDSTQIRALNGSALEADVRLQFQRVFRTAFNNVNSSATVNEQNVNVYRFYNADGTVPPAYKGTTFAGTHTHYLTSGGATIDPGDLSAIEDHLYHHGYRHSLGYRLLLLVNRQEGVIVRTFKAGVASSLYDFIPVGPGFGGGVYLPANSGIVDRPTQIAPVDGVIGTYGPWTVVEEDYIPAGYVFALASGGEKNIGNPIGIRQHLRPELRGLRLMPGPGQDYPLTDSFYQHGLGTGVRHRGAGVVMQITVSGTYTILALYT